MGELKTQPTPSDVDSPIDGIADESRREDRRALLGVADAYARVKRTYG